MNTKRMFALMFFVAAFAAVATSQRYGNTTSGLMPGPSMERAARQGYAPIDYAINNFGYGGLGYGYGGYYPDYGWRNGRSIIAGVAGFAGGYAVGRLTAPRDRREYVQTSDGGYAYNNQSRQVIYAASKPQKPLDCRKNKNRQACEAFAERARQEAEAREAERLAKKLYNRTGLPLDVSDCGKLVFPLRVNQNTWAPEAKCGYVGHMLVPDRDTAGLTVRIKADFRLAVDKSGWVFTAPKVEEN